MICSKNNFNLVLLYDLFQNQFNWYKIQDTQKRRIHRNFHMWQFPKWDTNTFTWWLKAFWAVIQVFTKHILFKKYLFQYPFEWKFWITQKSINNSIIDS